jgi:hypothetical protein
MAFGASGIVKGFAVFEIGALSFACIGRHFELFDIGRHIGKRLHATDLFRDGEGIHGGIVPVLCPDICKLLYDDRAMLAGNLRIGAIGCTPTLGHVTDGAAFINPFAIGDIGGQANSSIQFELSGIPSAMT